jgi:galactosylceramidase
MRAMQPWSGHYTVDPNIWITGHTGQFTKVGWKYVPGASGLLPNGGSYVTLVSPDASDFTVVIEKLEGNCQYCHAESQTQSEAVTLQLIELMWRAKHKALQRWASNHTTQFHRLADVTVGADGRTVPVLVQKDSIVTISTVIGAHRGSFTPIPIPPSAPFPLPFAEDFESRTPGSFARFFADNGGTFEITKDPTSRSNGQVLQQMVTRQAKNNLWTSNVLPITIFGGLNWTDVTVTVTVYLSEQAATDADAVVGVCQRAQGGHGGGAGLGGLCLQLFSNDTWAIGDRAGHSLKRGAIKGKVAGKWRVLSFAVLGGSVTAGIDGAVVASGLAAGMGNGRVALVSGFHTAFFDNVTVQTTKSKQAAARQHDIYQQSNKTKPQAI